MPSPSIPLVRLVFALLVAVGLPPMMPGALRAQLPVTSPAGGGALSEADRVAGLALLWSEAAANFPFFDRVPGLDWDATFREFIPQVVRAPTTLEYYRVLQRFVARLEDGHTRVILPDSIVKRNPFDIPWVRVREVGRTAVVADVGRRLATRLPVGSVIIAVDGIETGDYLRHNVFPFMAVSGDHVRWRDGVAGNLAQGWGLLVGPSGTPVSVTARTPAGDVVTLELRRTRRRGDDAWADPPVSRRILDFRWEGRSADRIAYLALNTFNEDAVVTGLDSLMPELREARGIVIDLRTNHGGRDAVVHAVLDRLVADTLLGPAWRTRVHNAAYRAWGRIADRNPELERYRVYDRGAAWHVAPPDTFIPTPRARVEAPIVVLTSSETESSAENFLVYVHGNRRFTLVGQATGGSSGQPLFMDLPGGGRAWVVTKRNTYADGREYMGAGVIPDIVVAPTVEDIRDGLDPVLARGIEALRAASAALGHRR